MKIPSYITEDDPEFHISIIDCDAIKYEAISYEYYVFRMALELTNRLVSIYLLDENDLEQLQLFLIKAVQVYKNTKVSFAAELVLVTRRKGVLKNSIDLITQVLSVDPTIRAKLRLLGITNDPNA